MDLIKQTNNNPIIVYVVSAAYNYESHVVAVFYSKQDAINEVNNIKSQNTDPNFNSAWFSESYIK